MTRHGQQVYSLAQASLAAVSCVFSENLDKSTFSKAGKYWGDTQGRGSVLSRHQTQGMAAPDSRDQSRAPMVDPSITPSLNVQRLLLLHEQLPLTAGPLGFRSTFQNPPRELRES